MKICGQLFITIFGHTDISYQSFQQSCEFWSLLYLFKPICCIIFSVLLSISTLYFLCSSPLCLLKCPIWCLCILLLSWLGQTFLFVGVVVVVVVARETIPNKKKEKKNRTSETEFSKEIFKFNSQFSPPQKAVLLVSRKLFFLHLRAVFFNIKQPVR